jgi:hypothetical protein
MDGIRATVKSGRLELDVPPEWCDGTQVLIERAPASLLIGIDESQWSDDPASVADWDSWIKTIEPLEFTSEEAEKIAQFDQQMRFFNREVVRRQMQDRNGE